MLVDDTLQLKQKTWPKANSPQCLHQLKTDIVWYQVLTCVENMYNSSYWMMVGSLIWHKSIWRYAATSCHRISMLGRMWPMEGSTTRIRIKKILNFERKFSEVHNLSRSCLQLPSFVFLFPINLTLCSDVSKNISDQLVCFPEKVIFNLMVSQFRNRFGIPAHHNV